MCVVISSLFVTKSLQTQIVCTLSDEQLPGAKGKVKRQVLPMSQARGDGGEIFHDVLPMDDFQEKPHGVTLPPCCICLILCRYA